MYEQLRFFIKNSTKIRTPRISVKEGDQTTRYSLFTSTLEGVTEKYYEDNNEADTIEEIDEDKLCEVILTTKGIKLHVNSTNTVLEICFSLFHCSKREFFTIVFLSIFLYQTLISDIHTFILTLFVFIKLEILSRGNPNFVYESPRSLARHKYLQECQAIRGHRSHAFTVELIFPTCQTTLTVLTNMFVLPYRNLTFLNVLAARFQNTRPLKSRT